MARKTHGLGKRLATLALGATLLAACGSTSTALSGTTDSGQHTAVIHDPDNPAWVGSSALATKAATGTRSVIHDPDNPYWGSNTAAATSDEAIVPVRGPK